MPLSPCRTKIRVSGRSSVAANRTTSASRPVNRARSVAVVEGQRAVGLSGSGGTSARRRGRLRGDRRSLRRFRRPRVAARPRGRRRRGRSPGSAAAPRSSAASPGLHPDLGRAMGAVEQAQRRRLQPQPVQQLAQRLALPEEALQERQAELVGEVVDRLLLGGDRPGEAEAVEHVQERPALTRPRPSGRRSGTPASPRAARGRRTLRSRLRRSPGAIRSVAELQVLGRGVSQPVEQPGIALLQRRLQLVHGADGRQARLGQERVQSLLLIVVELLVDVGSTTTTTRGSLQSRHPLQGLDPPPAGQVVADRPERPPALGALARSGMPPCTWRAARRRPGSRARRGMCSRRPTAPRRRPPGRSGPTASSDPPAIGEPSGPSRPRWAGGSCRAGSRPPRARTSAPKAGAPRRSGSRR